jgi:hypothetical protein
MFRAATLAFVCIIVLSATAPTVFAQPENNDCIDATPISGFGTFGFDTAGGNTDGLDNNACCAFSSCAIHNDVWYCWTANDSGPVAAQTCSLTTLDTRLAVYDGCTCPEGSGILACNDDTCDLQSRVEWTAVAGHSYLIRLGAYGQLDFGNGQIELLENTVPVLAGPFTNPNDGHTYYLLANSSWSAAEGAAVALGGHLATVNDFDENEFLRSSVLGFDGQDRRGWIGLNDFGNEGVFTWTSGEPVNYTNWNAGEPNNSGGNENAVEMFGSNGEWNDNTDSPPFLVFGIVEITQESPCPGDLDHDDIVGLQDLATLLAHFGTTSGATPEDGDLDNDTDVDLQDLATLLAAFGTACP